MAPVRPHIENLLGKASWGYDEADPDLIASCFAEDARMSLRIGRDGQLVGPFEGRAAIRALHADSIAAQTDQRRHNISNLWFEKESADERAPIFLVHAFEHAASAGRVAGRRAKW